MTLVDTIARLGSLLRLYDFQIREYLENARGVISSVLVSLCTAMSSSIRRQIL